MCTCQMYMHPGVSKCICNKPTDKQGGQRLRQSSFILQVVPGDLPQFAECTPHHRRHLFRPAVQISVNHHDRLLHVNCLDRRSKILPWEHGIRSTRRASGMFEFCEFAAIVRLGKRFKCYCRLLFNNTMCLNRKSFKIR